MFHKLISIDTGTECYLCGAVFDLYTRDDDGLSTGEYAGPFIESDLPCVEMDQGSNRHLWTYAGPRTLECAFCHALYGAADEYPTLCPDGAA